MGSSLSVGGLLDRVDKGGVFSRVYKLNTVVICSEDGKDVEINTSELRHQARTEDDKRKFSLLMRTYDNEMDALFGCARHGFEESRHPNKPYWVRKAGAARPDVKEDSTLAQSMDLTPQKPATRQSQQVLKENVGATVTPDQSFRQVSTRSDECYFLDSRGNALFRRKLILEDAFRLTKGTELLFCGLREFYDPIALNLENGTYRIFSRGEEEYVQIPTRVKDNLNGNEYMQCSDITRGGFIEKFEQGDGIYVQGLDILIKFSQIFHGVCELWDMHPRMPSRDYLSVLTMPTQSIYKVKKKQNEKVSSETQKRRSAAASRMPKRKRIRDVVRTRLGLVKNALPYMLAIKKEIWGDRHEMLALASVMHELKKITEAQHSSQELKKHREAIENLAKNAPLSMNVDHLATELSKSGGAWCDDFEVDLDSVLNAVFSDGYSDFDETLLSIDAVVESLEKSCPLLWAYSGVVIPEYAKYRRARREAKKSLRLVLCLSAMRSRNYKLLTKFALILRLAAMASGKGDHMLTTFLGLEVSKTQARTWMKRNYMRFRRMQREALLVSAHTVIIADNFQFFKKMSFQDHGRSAIPVHGTMSAMVRRRLQLWLPGDVLSYSSDGSMWKFKVLLSSPLTDDCYEIEYKIEALSACTVPAKSSMEVVCDIGSQISVVLPSDGWRLYSSNRLVPHPPLTYKSDQETPRLIGMQMSTAEYYRRVKLIQQCSSLSELLSSKEELTMGKRNNQLTANQKRFFDFWTARSKKTDEFLGRAHKDMVKTWNPHAEKKSQWVWMELTDHTETESEGLRAYMCDRFEIMVRKLYLIVATFNDMVHLYLRLLLCCNKTQGMLKKDGKRLVPTDRLQHMKVFLYGDWKTIEGIHKLIANLYEHAELDDVPAHDEKALLEAFKHTIPIHGDLHVAFHILDAIFRLGYAGYIEVFKDLLGMSRIQAEPLGRIFASREIVFLIRDRLRNQFLCRFIEDGAGMAAIVNAENCTGGDAEQCMQLAESFVDFLLVQQNVEDDAFLRFNALFLKASDALSLYEESIRLGDAPTTYKALLECSPLFETSGKSKYVNLVFHYTEVASRMDPGELMEEAMNHTVKMNEGKGNIAQDDVAEKGNLFLKSGEELPTDMAKLKVRSFYLGLCNKCNATRRQLLGYNKDTRSAKRPPRIEGKKALLEVLRATRAVYHTKGRTQVNLLPYAVAHKVKPRDYRAETAKKRESNENEFDGQPTEVHTNKPAGAVHPAVQAEDTEERDSDSDSERSATVNATSKSGDASDGSIDATSAAYDSEDDSLYELSNTDTSDSDREVVINQRNIRCSGNESEEAEYSDAGDESKQEHLTNYGDVDNYSGSESDSSEEGQEEAKEEETESDKPKSSEISGKNSLLHWYKHGDENLKKKSAKRKATYESKTHNQELVEQAKEYHEKLTQGLNAVLIMIGNQELPKPKGRWAALSEEYSCSFRKQTKVPRSVHDESPGSHERMQNEIIETMTKDEFGSDISLDPFQSTATRRLFFQNETLLMVQPTGTGKTLPFVLMARLVGGISVLISPLLGINTNHDIEINASKSSLCSINVDGIPMDRVSDVITAFKQYDPNTTSALVLIMSPRKFVSKKWRACLKHFAANGLLRFIGVDEIHQIALNHKYRHEFRKIDATLNVLGIKGKIPFLAMTATFDGDLLDEFLQLIKINFSLPFLWKSEFGRVSLYRHVRNRTTETIKTNIARHICHPRKKVIVYSLERNRVESVLAKTVRNKVQKLGVENCEVDVFHGERPKKMKALLIRDFKAESHLRILCVTNAGNAGISSPFCGGVEINGPVENIYDWAQLMGRTGRKGSVDVGPLGPECHISMSVSLFENLLRQIDRTTSSQQQELELMRAYDFMEILMFSTKCINKLLQERLSEPEDSSQNESAPPNSPRDNSSSAIKCNKCWVCRGEQPLEFDRLAIIGLLSANAFSGKVCPSKEVLKVLNANSEQIWPKEVNGRKANSQDSEFLLLQLIVSKIIGYKCQTPDDKQKQKGPRRVAVEYFWNQTGEYPNCKMIYNCKTTWTKFRCKSDAEAQVNRDEWDNGS